MKTLTSMVLGFAIVCSHAQRTRLVIDTQTLSAAQPSSMQALADSVAQQVDTLIPSSEGRLPIVVYQVSGDEVGLRPLSAPVTLSADSVLPGEPSSVKPGSLRIALFNIEARDATPLTSRFIFQLAHELAHVKMGVGPKSSDNYLVETFACLVAREVLLRMGQALYYQILSTDSLSQLPAAVQYDYVHGNWDNLRAYWQAQSKAQGTRIDDRPFQELGVQLITQGGFKGWAGLADLARSPSNCKDIAPFHTSICEPAVGQMSAVRQALVSLGYPM